MSRYEQLEKIINDGDIEELKKFICNQDIIDDMINKALLHASYNGKLNIVKYILNNYSSKIEDHSIGWSLHHAYYNHHLDTAKYIELYKIIRNNTIICKKTVIYKKTVIFNF